MSKNIHKYSFSVTRENREAISGHKAMVLWFTGLSASGKSTIANNVEKELNKKQYNSYILDGDNVRSGLNKDLGFSPADRNENIRRIIEVSKLFVDSGKIVLCSFISPYRNDREMAREILGEHFVEIFVNTPIEECIKRDPKGLYKMAISGEIKNFTGVSAPYEKPLMPEILIENLSLKESVKKIIDYVEKN
jgi:adenylylsulfate kinase|tara:strand:- start:227 stop:802 length:576 start_codon:yes stop_codon:yes gene_type:complete